MANKKKPGPLADTAIIKLDGTRIKKDGTVDKLNFFDFLEQDLSDYSDIEMTPELARSFKSHVNKLKYGTSSMIPIWCPGQKCFNKTCPFLLAGNPPVGRQCLLEAALVKTKTQDYVEDINLNPENSAEMALVNKLVECDILDMRINIGLSGTLDADAYKLLITNITDNGNTISESVDIHPLITIKEKVQNMREKILTSLVGTPREKYKKAAALKKSESSDASTMLSKLKEQMLSGQFADTKKHDEKIKKELEELDTGEVIDADWELEEFDDQ